jgi:asparaginyl-tRNA synthetase
MEREKMTREFVTIADILQGKFDRRKVWIRGWIYRARSSGKLVFQLLRDSSGIVQTVVDAKEVNEREFELAKECGIESSIAVEGIVKDDRRAPGGKEIRVKTYVPYHKAEPFPITEDQSTELLLDKRHLWVRSRKQWAIMRLKAKLLKIFREWFENHGFLEVTPPIITTSAAEGGATAFELTYFGKKAYLSQTAQMYLEALIFSADRVWSLTPSFRSEKSRTRKHLIEYMHLEAEAAWVDNEENMRVQENLVSYAADQIARKGEEELKVIGSDPDKFRNFKPPFRRIDYTDAVEFLQQKGVRIEWGDDFGTPHEDALLKEYNEPLFVTNFPKKCKAFYMKENPKNRDTYLCNDLLVPGGGEIIGASERETDVNSLIERLHTLGVENPEKMDSGYAWYLDLRRYGSVPHSGFGLGVERFLLWITQEEHIREMLPFPRTPSRFYP